jgi:hypothetical protein
MDQLHADKQFSPTRADGDVISFMAKLKMKMEGGGGGWSATSEYNFSHISGKGNTSWWCTAVILIQP